MTDLGDRVSSPPLPRAIWQVAWACLAGQVAMLAGHGARDDVAMAALSAGIGGLVVGWVSAGVVRARTVRLVIAWVVLVVAAAAELVTLLADDGEDLLLDLALLATSAVALSGMWAFRRTPWYAWQRTKPPAERGEPIGRLVAVGVLVGVLGGFVGATGDGVDVRIEVAAR